MAPLVSDGELARWVWVDLALLVLYAGAVFMVLIYLFRWLEDWIVNRCECDDDVPDADEDMVPLVQEGNGPVDIRRYRNLSPQFPGRRRDGD